MLTETDIRKLLAFQTHFCHYQKEYHALDAVIMKYKMDLRRQSPAQILRDMSQRNDWDDEERELLRMCLEDLEVAERSIG